VNVVPKYNLNRKRWVKIVLLIIAVLMVISPLFALVVHLIAL